MQLAFSSKTITNSITINQHRRIHQVFVLCLAVERNAARPYGTGTQQTLTQMLLLRLRQGTTLTSSRLPQCTTFPVVRSYGGAQCQPRPASSGSVGFFAISAYASEKQCRDRATRY
ncbi:unnamed protein product [Amoebophrya sp. A120]|nr:unnamed protein product [Amoebophrya sp. A120]|eukprot:GSA120T00015206001.1